MLHEEEPAEVLRFASEGPLLAGAGTGADLVLLHDFDAACARIDQPGPDSGWSVDWTDLREHQASTLGAVEYALSREERARFDELSSVLANDLSKLVLPRLKALGFARAHNEVSTDLWKIASSRLLQGKSHEFWERLFALYRDGLWPCGWDGAEYPGGRFVVFSTRNRP